jgi:hypothetical protein
MHSMALANREERSESPEAAFEGGCNSGRVTGAYPKA